MDFASNFMCLDSQGAMVDAMGSRQHCSATKRVMNNYR